MKLNNIYRDFDKEDVMDALYNSLERVKAPFWAYELLREALFDEDWDWYEDYDGCTFVQDPTHPYLPCLIHDWMWRTGKGGWASHVIFLHLQRIYGMNKFNRSGRTILTAIGWYFGYKWVRIAQRNVNPLTEGINNAMKNIKACR